MTQVGTWTVEIRHPGKMLYSICMEPKGMTAEDLAEITGMDAEYIDALIHGEADMTQEMADTLTDDVFQYSDPGSWMKAQRIWESEKSFTVPIIDHDVEYKPSDVLHSDKFQDVYETRGFQSKR